jgi:glycosyltransferase involved in cell wall biosynthesis
MKLSIVMPVYNEAATIHEIVARVRAIERKKEMLIVDDGSSDGTAERLKEIDNQYDDVNVFYHEKNRGKGAALQTGFAKASGDIVIIHCKPVLQKHPEISLLSRMPTWSMIRVITKRCWFPSWMAERTWFSARVFSADHTVSCIFGTTSVIN